MIHVNASLPNRFSRNPDVYVAGEVLGSI
ncbi:uncharacterized protein METZ01_LOCUS365383, partial [marine metagenome]